MGWIKVLMEWGGGDTSFFEHFFWDILWDIFWDKMWDILWDFFGHPNVRPEMRDEKWQFSDSERSKFCDSKGSKCCEKVNNFPGFQKIPCPKTHFPIISIKKNFFAVSDKSWSNQGTNFGTIFGTFFGTFYGTKNGTICGTFLCPFIDPNKRMVFIEKWYNPGKSSRMKGENPPHRKKSQQKEYNENIQTQTRQKSF